MKRVWLLALTVIVSLTMMAGNVTPEKALQQATSFVQSRIQKGEGPRMAPGTPLHLNLASRVSGLYVFNVSNNGGFVIVSPDDCAQTILGYSDCGQFDPDNIPCNMRAWLQGYADEIAWAQQQTAEGRLQTTGNRANAPAAIIKTPIAPLIETRWDQGTPYNNLCPEYAAGEHAITGCVATAMAQVMYYHKWPEATTMPIPSYDDRWWSSPSLPAAVTTFNWNDMQLTYDGTETTETAVATLMYYCGISVKMDYGNNANAMSGASSSDIEYALETYFNYSTTTKYVSRSYYSYGDWINLIYHELEEGRPVLYGGSSDGGGHEFVCDGYQGEDFFHINWGWSGMSDNYFKLSALNPYAQGSGGSSSNDGFHYGQDAVIGIQKPNDTGTILDVTETQVNLSLKSISIDKSSVSAGEPVTITLKVTNNASDDYDGDLWIGEPSTFGLLVGDNFVIPSGTTKECEITYTPEGFTGTIYIYGYFPANDGNYYRWDNKYVSLTVTSGGGGGTITTSNISLDHEITVHNSEGNNFYGSGNTNTFEATLKVINPESSKNYYGSYQLDLYELVSNNFSLVGRYNDNISVPANSTLEIPIEFGELSNNKTYYLYRNYVKGNTWAGWVEIGEYMGKPGVTIYTADGTKSSVKPATPYNVPSDALVVDLSGAGVTTVTKNGQPNCLYIIGSGETVPNGLTNIITNSTGNHHATNITLTDGNAFYSPFDFDADNVSFTYNFTVGADGTDGWNTLILPFNVTKVTADDEPIDWFHRESDTGKDFWVKEFTGDDPTEVYFDFAENMNANTPYIVALPGNKWGPDWDLSNKVIKFIGENVKVCNTASIYTITGDSYRFIGKMHDVDTEDIYCLNAQGNKFVLTNGSGAFRAFFKPDAFDRTVTSLGIGSGTGHTTDIVSPLASDHSPLTEKVYYDLSGRRVEHPTKGLYIINGKKVVIK